MRGCLRWLPQRFWTLSPSPASTLLRGSVPNIFGLTRCCLALLTRAASGSSLTGARLFFARGGGVSVRGGDWGIVAVLQHPPGPGVGRGGAQRGEKPPRLVSRP